MDSMNTHDAADAPDSGLALTQTTGTSTPGGPASLVHSDDIANHERFLSLNGVELLELLSEAGQDRAITVALLAGQLAAGRTRALAILQGRQAGLACAQALSGTVDAILRALHVLAVDKLHPLANPTSGERMAIIAVGGYGRRTLAPGSDVDLLFLMPHKVTAWGETVVESMLYPLWDLRLKVGHSTRSISECMHEARNDMTVRTALLEARFVAGDRDLYKEMRQRFDEEIVRLTAPEFVEAKLAERDARVNKAGASRYLVEPNVKDGKGGLRDLNTLFWIAKYVYRVRDPRDLIKAGLFTREEFQVFRTAEEFLWRTRCWMHFITGRAEERLSFDLQRQVAARMGVAGRGGLSEVERFMKRYFLIAKDVGDLTAIVCAALEARHQKTRPTLQRLFGGFRQQARTRTVGHPAFIIDGDRLAIRSADGFATDPVNLIRLYALAARNDLAVHPDTSRLVTRSLKLIGPALRRDPEANRLFLELLTSKTAAEAALRRMNEAGVLGRFIPDFGRVVAMMQFNMYHHYTVDEHLLRAVGNLAQVESGTAGRGPCRWPATILPTISNRRALYVAVFLHDVAKGRPEDHSIAGARTRAQSLAPGMGLSGRRNRKRRMADREPSGHVEHRAEPRPGSDRQHDREHSPTLVQTPERLKMLLIAHGLPTFKRGRAGRVERLERPAAALALLGDRSRADRRPFRHRPASRAWRRHAGRVTGAAAGRAGRTPSSHGLCSSAITPPTG